MRRHGFTLIELLVTLATLAVLATVAIPLSEISTQREKERDLKRALWSLRDGIDNFKRARDSGAIKAAAGASPYPSNLGDLTRAWPDARPDYQGQSIRIMRSIPRDPFADGGIPADQTWELRCYACDVDKPHPGVDVFDVHSMSDRQALDGTLLRTW